MHRQQFSRQLAALIALFHLALGCGDDSSKSSPGADGGASGASDANAGDTSAGAGGACDSKTCRDLGLECGDADDGCGHSIHCGDACLGAGGEGGSGGGACDPDAVLAARPATARRARSAGYQGTDEDYLSLFDVACQTPADCASSCKEAGGAQTFCDASECLPNGQVGNDCVPAPVWENLDTIQSQDASSADMCQLILVHTAYQDVLLTDEFKLEVPDGASIRGLTVEVRRVGDDSVTDASVRIIKDGQIGAAERALPQTWSPDVSWVTYGGPTDLWGEQWTAKDLNSDLFGVALSAAYGQNVGNTRAYVDQVRVTVSYQLSCN